MCSFGGGSYEAAAVPKAVPGATNVSTGETQDSDLSLSRALEKQRKRRGAASTVRNEGGAGGVASSSSGGKKTFGGD